MEDVISDLSKLNISDNEEKAINARIRNEICQETLTLLKDDNMFEVYKKCTSVKKILKNLKKF